MTQDRPAGAIRPGAWLHEVARLRPAKWNFRISVRAMIAIAGPMTLGWLTGTLGHVMWIAMGAMFPSIGEREAPYGVTLRKILISTPIGVSGFLMGYLGTSGLDWGWIVLIMGVLGIIAAILSSLSAAISVGCLQFMVMAAVSLGNPELQVFWQPVLLMLAGSALYVALFLIETRWLPHHVYRDAISDVMKALMALARGRAAGGDIEQLRLDYSLKYDALYTMMLQSRYQALGHNSYLDHLADIVQALDGVFSQLMGPEDSADPAGVASGLERMLAAMGGGGSPDAGTGSDRMGDLARAMRGDPTGTGAAFLARQTRQDFTFALRELVPGPATLRNALALGLCTAIGYSIRWLDDASHWYWVPMTVAIVMKPELGSIFARAMQRTIGTAAGVLVGGIMLHFVPVGPLFLMIIAGIVFVMPWLSQKNYALCAFALTPMVLALLDFVSPGLALPGLGLGGLRLVDTAIGCMIVLIFGYLIWPRGHVQEFSQAARGVGQAIADYLLAALGDRATGRDPGAARIAAYGKVVDMRATLQKGMAEPPPAGYEAAAWFPLVAAQARLCDAITAWLAGADSVKVDSDQADWLRQAARAVAEGKGMDELPAHPPVTDAATSALFLRIEQEFRLMRELYERKA